MFITLFWGLLSTRLSTPCSTRPRHIMFVDNRARDWVKHMISHSSDHNGEGLGSTMRMRADMEHMRMSGWEERRATQFRAVRPSYYRVLLWNCCLNYLYLERQHFTSHISSSPSRFLKAALVCSTILMFLHDAEPADLWWHGVVQ